MCPTGIGWSIRWCPGVCPTGIGWSIRWCPGVCPILLGIRCPIRSTGVPRCVLLGGLLGGVPRCVLLG